MALKPVTVSQLNDYIARVIGTDPLLGAVAVKGEIFNLKYHSTGHVYFSIMDAASKIQCFMPRNVAMELNFPLEDGMEVIITGQVRVFNKNGTYSLNVKFLEREGAGQLAIAFEAMKNKLLKEGLFDPKYKKPIPKFPKKIGIVTSPTGAAVKDILKILKSRNNLVDIMIFPVLVQGPSAPEDISSMIDLINERFDDIDLLIVGRGGGSGDDLWAFNEECVARSIFRSRIPIISAVGHEIDFTISDMVADLRAETPTAAAQIAVPDGKELSDRLEQMKDSLSVHMSNMIMYNKLLIENISNDMKNSINSKIEGYKNQLETAGLMLEENNPIKILGKGFSVITDDRDKVIDTVNALEIGKSYGITLKDGRAECVITGIGSESNGQV
ncbi:MAG: exodeoxyribonuclease VII large subunit [Eubacteriaceae bacterium]|nr:exodeoxyribonuclease VII large subunit [Eubacteriaceae bacterium]